MPRPSLFSYMTPFGKLMLLLLIMFTTFLLTLFIGFLVGMPFFGPSMLKQLEGVDLTDPAMTPLLKYFQILSALGFFVFPPLIFARFLRQKAGPFFLAGQRPDGMTSMWVCCLMILTMPLISWLIDLNLQMQLPAFLSSVEDWMKASEDQAETVTRVFLSTTTWQGLSVNLLMVAILPAVGEELVFRGTLIRLFREWTGNIHVAVIIVAFLFSSMHMQFYGFLPRLVLGLLLGYLFVWTANLWIVILAHFINNGFAVIAAFINARKLSPVPFDEIGSHPAAWQVLLSLVLSAMLLWIIFLRSRSVRQLT